MRKGHINNLNDLQKWFMRFNHPTWNLYREFQTGNYKSSQLVYKQTDDGMSVEDSFTLLAEMIEINSNGGGRFTVFVNHLAGNKGASTFVGMNLQPYSQSAVSGMPGQPYNIGMIESEVEKRIEKERKMWELEAMVQGLVADQEEKKGAGERFFNKIMEEVDLETVLPSVINAVVNLIPKKAPIILQGTPEEMQQQQTTPTTEETSDTDDTQGFQYKSDLLLPVLDQIRNEFEGEDEFYQFLVKVAEKFKANPDFFKNIIING